MKETAQSRQLQVFYQTLYNTWGQPHWWPARTRFEVIVGAYLTQNTAWTNVERALSRLRAAGVLNLPGIRNTPLWKLESMIRSAGYFRQKAKRLKIFVDFLDEQYGGSLSRMFAQPTEKLREELLALNGIGPETADSILLYAGQHAVFIVDTYTRRVLDRHSILPSSSPYEEIRSFCEDALVALDLPAAVDERDLRAGAPGACHAPSRMSLANVRHWRRSITKCTDSSWASARIIASNQNRVVNNAPCRLFCPNQSSLSSQIDLYPEWYDWLQCLRQRLLEDA